MFVWRNIYRGLLMGVSDLIPGVSGGTIAMVLGIYRRLISGINGLMSKNWKKELGFFIPLLIGVGLALLLVSQLMEKLLKHYPQPTFFFFIGLIVGVVPFLLRKVEYKKTFEPVHYGLLILAAVLIASTLFLKGEGTGEIMKSLSFTDYVLLFLSGWLASTAMILPGVSGSFVLLLLGSYHTVIHGLSSFQIPLLLTVGAGIIIGLSLTGKLISLLLKKYTVSTYSVMIGLVIGSVVVLYPGFKSDITLAVTSIGTLLLGLGTAFILGRIEHKQGITD
ncbi:DUF368 domain-containing protein [Pseudalkalibacillus hwajinpoensis]|uniref:DUF368 domain-containing protein n=1 Tax=Guptibacillus hwajinpoensis TaxID=208199 RepID=A0A4U1MP84_9BACL|nr:DUF368 domain-containing protein [Pseudalkalibacillus hwajinpoensis]TKD72531.1 DUF368 domain-containing protein [Pseudalkalibacillus hwajinpoensis]